MAVENPRRIAKSNNKTKLIEFTDRMGFNDFSKESGVISSTVHNKFSRIVATIVDWTNGKGDKAIVVNHNLNPLVVKTIAHLVLSGNTVEFEKMDNYSKQTGFFEQKIDYYKKDENGMSPVSKFNIRYQANMSSPWTISIENGLGVALISDIGGVSIKSGSYQKLKTSTVYLSKTEMVAKMVELTDYINAFEQAFFKDMIVKRMEYEKKAKEAM